MGKCAKEEISANTKLKAELTKTQKSLLGYCHHAVTAHERSRQSQSRGEEAEEQLLSQCQGEVWQHSLPVKVTHSSGNFLAPLVFPARQQQLWKTATSSLSPARVFFCISSAKWISLSCAQTGTMPPFSRAHRGQRNSAGRAPSDNSLSHQAGIFQGCLSSLDSRPSLQHRAGQHRQGRRVSGAGICHWPCKTL